MAKFAARQQLKGKLESGGCFDKPFTAVIDEQLFKS